MDRYWQSRMADCNHYRCESKNSGVGEVWRVYEDERFVCIRQLREEILFLAGVGNLPGNILRWPDYYDLSITEKPQVA